jgi:hypothetical protein
MNWKKKVPKEWLFFVCVVVASALLLGVLYCSYMVIRTTFQVVQKPPISNALDELRDTDTLNKW